MNPQHNGTHNETSGMQLPPPVMEQAPIHSGEPGQVAPEQSIAARPEQSAGTQFAAAAMPASIPLPIQPAIPVNPSQNDVSNTTQSTTPMLADDGDLIEKEWVQKAKAIVERTAEDPYRQSEELTAFKADYMKQRYNKSIKITK